MAKKNQTIKNLARVSGKQADANQAKAIMQLQKKVKKLSKLPETKWHYLQATSSCSTAWNIYEMSVTSQAAADSGHIGNSIMPKLLKIDGLLEPNATAGINQVRVFVAQVKGSNAEFQTGTQIPQGSSAIYNYLAQVNPNVAEGFYKILYDNVFTLNTVDKPNVKFSITCKPRHRITYPEGGSTSAEDGFLLLGFVGDNGTNFPTFEFSSMLLYTDC